MPTKPTYLNVYTKRLTKGSEIDATENDNNIQNSKDSYNFLGMVMLWMLPETYIPDGWLPCDGRSLAKAGTYSDLYGVLGDYYGSDALNFNLPDMRGYVPRMVDTTTEGSASRDPNESTRVITGLTGATTADPGSTQEDEVDSHDHGGGDHTHTILSNTGSSVGGTSSLTVRTLSPNDAADTGFINTSGNIIDPVGGDETRMKNIYCMYIMLCQGGL